MTGQQFLSFLDKNWTIWYSVSILIERRVNNMMQTVKLRDAVLFAHVR